MKDDPITKVILVKCPLEIDNNNQLTFSSLSAQLQYFSNLETKEYEQFTYQRHDNYIRLGSELETIMDYNYVMYQNANYGNKWFFAFITRMEWQNPNLTDVYIKTDVFQTWQFDLTYKPSFIEREHVNDDSIGLHTIPENLETGDYINQGSSTDTDFGEYAICVALSEDILTNDTSISHNTYNGVASGLTYIALQDSSDLNYLILRYEGKIDAIYSVFMIPQSFLVNINWITDTTGTVHYQYIREQTAPFNLDNVSILKPTRIGELPSGYQPKNNKLFTYPYCFLEGTNNVGMSVIYKYEDFVDDDYNYTNQINFHHKGTISPGCAIKCIPLNYKGIIGENLDESFNCAKLPVGGWINDVFTNWLTQNGVNVGVGILGNITNTIFGGILTAGGVAGGNPWTTLAGTQQITSGIESILDNIGSVYQHSLVPNQAEGNVNASDIIFSMNKSGSSFYQKSIKTEYARVIDNFWSMFGYKVNIVKIPNITGRQNWNYIKTVGLNLVANIPQTAIEEIKNMFDKGITLWHNPNTFLDYSQSNNIV